MEESTKKVSQEVGSNVLLKFELSERDHETLIGLVSQNTKTECFNGVREKSKYPKKICIADKNISHKIIPGVLYDTTIIPMKSGKGYIAIKAEPYQFAATVKTVYRPHQSYKVVVQFGHKKLIFDPMNGDKPSRQQVNLVRRQIEKRLDLHNINGVLAEFDVQAHYLMQLLKQDGYYDVPKNLPSKTQAAS